MDLATRWSFFVEAFIEKEGYRDVLAGLGNTFKISLLGLLIGMAVGTMIAAIRVMPKNKLYARISDKVGMLYVALFRGTPIVVQLLIGYFVIMPLLGSDMTAENACVLIFGLNSGAYVSEIMRGGINSVDPGQTEAGRALGLSYSVTMFRFVVPQALKNIMPTLGNEFVSLIKETSVISFVGATDLTVALKRLGENSYDSMIPYLVMAACYIAIVYVITAFITMLEKHLAKNEKKRGSQNG